MFVVCSSYWKYAEFIKYAPEAAYIYIGDTERMRGYPKGQRCIMLEPLQGRRDIGKINYMIHHRQAKVERMY